MTGFATLTRELLLEDGMKLDVIISLKSLNSRFFELTARLPSQFSNLEVDLHKLLKKELVRGHAFLTIKVHNQEQLKKPVSISTSTVQTYMTELQALQKKFSLPGQINLELILQLPQIISFEEKELDEDMHKDIMHMAQEIITLVRKEQIKEGALLYKELQHRISIIKKAITKLKKMALAVIEKRHKKLASIMQEYSAQVVDSTAYQLMGAQKESLILELEKTDITEEIVRFGVHLDHFKEMLDDTKEIAKGKKIDFLLQELHREINTISAKINHADISHIAVDIKTELEKAKEQIQNII